MKKYKPNKVVKIGLILYFGTLLALLLIGLFSSCQPPPDPLKNAEFECTVTYKGFAHEIHINCKDSLYKFRCEKYSKAFNEKDTIFKPLNK